MAALHHTMRLFTLIICLAVAGTVGCKKKPPVDDKDRVLPGHHMSEHQVVDIAFRELPQNSRIQCDFKDGIWDISTVQTGVWGVSSVTTNADGKVVVSSTNAMQVVLRVRDADGKIEQVK